MIQKEKKKLYTIHFISFLHDIAIFYDFLFSVILEVLFIIGAQVLSHQEDVKRVIFEAKHNKKY